MPFRSNLSEFIRVVTNATKMRDRELIKVHKKIVLEALTRIVLKNPVRKIDGGRSRGGWQVTLDTPAEGQVSGTDKSGVDTINKGLVVLDQLEPLGVVWISNNVEYIEYLEAGHSKQAPEGMVAVTVEELKAIFGE